MEPPPRLLVVDDSPESHELIDQLFGEHVLHATDGKAGLALLGQNPDIDAVVLDLAMPVMDGFTFLKRLRDDHRHHLIPVCVFTANKADVTQALSLGAKDFVDKRTDYQELKLRILNLVDSKRHLEAANRAKTDFLAVVSHELRTPMNGILGMTEALRDDALSDDQSRYLDVLEQSSRKLMDLVNDVLQFLDSENPLHSLPRSAFSPRLTVKAVLRLLEADAVRNKCTLEAQYGPDLPEAVIGLPDKLTLVLRHLIGNAIKFTPGGSVTVNLSAAEVTARHATLLFVVKDTGVGFPDGWKTRIFQPFTQLDGSDTRKFGGLGLGLSVAGRMVQMLGGHLDAESERGRGSQFKFILTFPLPESR